MLPNIFDVAQAYDLIFQPKQYGKKETLAKFPFCKADANWQNERNYIEYCNSKNGPRLTAIKIPLNGLHGSNSWYNNHRSSYNIKNRPMQVTWNGHNRPTPSKGEGAISGIIPQKA